MARFIESALQGRAMSDEIDDFVDAWHDSSSKETLAEFLGMTDDEYEAWVLNPDVIPQILTARKFRRPFAEVLEGAYEERLAARSGSADRLAEMKRWLARRHKRT